MKISVIAPMKNEAQFLGYSVMAVAPYVHEFIYAVASSSDDGTIDLLSHLKEKLGDKLRFFVSDKYDFNPLDRPSYNGSFNDCIEASSGDAVWFLHPDMIVTNPEKIAELKAGPLAWWVNVTSFAGDLRTVITKGRTNRWKNIHAKKFGLRYFGGYGSQNEDFYHSDITGTSYKHYGDDFAKYPFEVAASGIDLNHYCEVKPYARRLEKMKLSLKTQHPAADPGWIEEKATHHPRVTLEPTNTRFGEFEFKSTDEDVPEVFSKYQEEFAKFIKEPVHA